MQASQSWLRSNVDYVGRPIQYIYPDILRVNTLATSAARNILVYMIITSYYDNNYALVAVCIFCHPSLMFVTRNIDLLFIKTVLDHRKFCITTLVDRFAFICMSIALVVSPSPCVRRI